MMNMDKKMDNTFNKEQRMCLQKSGSILKNNFYYPVLGFNKEYYNIKDPLKQCYLIYKKIYRVLYASWIKPDVTDPAADKKPPEFMKPGKEKEVLAPETLNNDIKIKNYNGPDIEQLKSSIELNNTEESRIENLQNISGDLIENNNCQNIVMSRNKGRPSQEDSDFQKKNIRSDHSNNMEPEVSSLFRDHPDQQNIKITNHPGVKKIEKRNTNSLIRAFTQESHARQNIVSENEWKASFINKNSCTSFSSEIKDKLLSTKESPSLDKTVSDIRSLKKPNNVRPVDHLITNSEKIKPLDPSRHEKNRTRNIDIKPDNHDYNKSSVNKSGGSIKDFVRLLSSINHKEDYEHEELSPDKISRTDEVIYHDKDNIKVSRSTEKTGFVFDEIDRDNMRHPGGEEKTLSLPDKASWPDRLSYNPMKEKAKKQKSANVHISNACSQKPILKESVKKIKPDHISNIKIKNQNREIMTKAPDRYHEKECYFESNDLRENKNPAKDHSIEEPCIDMSPLAENDVTSGSCNEVYDQKMMQQTDVCKKLKCRTMDIDDILEALKRDVRDEYKRFYGEI